MRCLSVFALFILEIFARFPTGSAWMLPVPELSVIPKTTSLTTHVKASGRNAAIIARYRQTGSCTHTLLFSSADDQQDNENMGDEDLFDLLSSNEASSGKGTPKLGIDLGSMLEPLSEQEAAELKAAATEVINDAIAQGIDEIDIVRNKMKREFEKKRKTMAARSEANTKREAAKLLNRIDALTDAFLESTEATRSSTKLAAAADASMEGRGLDVGAWGMIEGAAVTTGSLIGSVAKAQQDATKTKTVSTYGEKKEEPSLSKPQENRILIIADESQDPMAKKVIGPLTDLLQNDLPGLMVDIYKPTATLPIGGNNAACVILFLTSLSDKSTINNALDRILRKTLGADGAIGQPPSQLVAISTLGTERFNKMPYSMQNLLGGGKLEKRRQMEEAITNTVRGNANDLALDFTLCKFGELKDGSTPFELAPGDVLDGTTAPATALTVLSQAIAFQPAARNATLSAIGGLATTADQLFLDDAFLKLDGPELWRTELTSEVVDDDFDSLVEYMMEWSDLFADSGKGLTTPIRAQVVPLDDLYVGGGLPQGVRRAAGVQLLFLPTATGKNYLNRQEEKEQSGDAPARKNPAPLRKNAKEGGIQIMMEITTSGHLRVRAKRCNYTDEAVIKELSEETILSRLRESIDAWKKDHKQ